MVQCLKFNSKRFELSTAGKMRPKITKTATTTFRIFSPIIYLFHFRLLSSIALVCFRCRRMRIEKRIKLLGSLLVFEFDVKSTQPTFSKINSLHKYTHFNNGRKFGSEHGNGRCGVSNLIEVSAVLYSTFHTLTRASAPADSWFYFVEDTVGSVGGFDKN